MFSLLFHNFSSFFLPPYQDTLLRSVRQSKIHQTGVPMNSPTHKWTYASAFLYSLTLITTIGKSTFIYGAEIIEITILLLNFSISPLREVAKVLCP